MALCDQLEAARADREATRERFTVATFGRLTATNVGLAEFQEEARFALNSFAPLAANGPQVSALKEAIVDLAVQGRLLSGGAQSWTEVALSEVLEPLADGRIVHQGWSPQCEAVPSVDDGEWGVLKTTAIQLGRYVAEENKRLPSKLKPRDQYEVRAGDILSTRAGPRAGAGFRA
ncbi:MAG: hypothetical protein IPP90_13380 [Gemmatimonadaceae bacterium]|nr:hypothetical protein [Gemmatimonadaceae bacterium]